MGIMNAHLYIQGKPERDATFQPILRALEDHFPASNLDERKQKKILVPGYVTAFNNKGGGSHKLTPGLIHDVLSCGLGRLPYEIAKMGFSTQGNEFR